MSAQHTPGPWGLNAKGRLTAIPVRAHQCEALGISLCHVTSDRDGETEANARLIAAAPDLLAALQDLTEIALMQFGQPPADGDGPLPAALAAIAKAVQS